MFTVLPVIIMGSPMTYATKINRSAPVMIAGIAASDVDPEQFRARSAQAAGLHRLRWRRRFSRVKPLGSRAMCELPSPRESPAITSSSASPANPALLSAERADGVQPRPGRLRHQGAERDPDYVREGGGKMNAILRAS